jgi:tRNA (cytidine/uridine-2'-O-)-methyltransferase
VVRLVLVTPEIPANAGNVMRLAAATGIPLHLIEPLGFSMNDKALKRAVMDYREACRVERHLTFEELEQELPASRFLFLSARADKSFFDLKIAAGDVLVLGPESKGLSEEFLAVGRRREHTFRVPMPGAGRSLNLATTAGIVVYEALRQLNALAEPSQESPCRS